MDLQTCISKNQFPWDSNAALHLSCHCLFFPNDLKASIFAYNSLPTAGNIIIYIFKYKKKAVSWTQKCLCSSWTCSSTFYFALFPHMWFVFWDFPCVPPFLLNSLSLLNSTGSLLSCCLILHGQQTWNTQTLNLRAERLHLLPRPDHVTLRLIGKLERPVQNGRQAYWPRIFSDPSTPTNLSPSNLSQIPQIWIITYNRSLQNQGLSTATSIYLFWQFCVFLFYEFPFISLFCHKCVTQDSKGNLTFPSKYCGPLPSPCLWWRCFLRLKFLPSSPYPSSLTTKLNSYGHYDMMPIFSLVWRFDFFPIQIMNQLGWKW